VSLEDAAATGAQDTRHYAKRQFTWFRHQLPEFGWVSPADARGLLDRLLQAG
jgi:tRNA dimethylallyltransferase